MPHEELPSALRHQVNSYLKQEPLHNYRLCIEKLVQQAQNGNVDALNELQHRFVPMQFGTAGLRAVMGAGNGCMNYVTVCRVAWALGRHLFNRHDVQQLSEHGVVIAHDARHNSHDFAQAMAAVLAGLGVAVHLFDTAVPTPVCAFTTNAMGALAGVMVTASHNPATDNGVKIYRSDGAQIMENDSEPIAGLVQQAPAVNAMVLLQKEKQLQQGLRHRVAQHAIDAYFAAIAACHSCCAQRHEEQDVRIVHTSLHGVARDWVVRGLREAGFCNVHQVPQQADPNPDFPTTPYPNPQDPQTLQLAIELAQKVSADIVLANDPDVDRLAVCVPKTNSNHWEILDGNAVGVLLADWLLSSNKQDKQHSPLVVTTVVSSRLLSQIARHYGCDYAESLTGFRHIAQVVRKRHEKHRQKFVFGYEEALGYCLSNTPLEKDGICAAVAVANMLVHFRRQGRTVQQQLDHLALQHGLHHTDQFSLSFEGADGSQRMQQLMEHLRDNPALLTHWAGWNQQDVSYIDLLKGYNNLPSTNGLMWDAPGRGRIVVRPSGTEPKVKFYVEFIQSVSTLQQLQQTREQLHERFEQVKANILQQFVQGS